MSFPEEPSRDLNRPEAPDGDGLLPEPVAREPETLPDVRAEEIHGVVDRPRRGGPPVPPSTYAPRFRALTGGLVGLGIGALIAAGVALVARTPPEPARWSAWHPTKSGTAGADQIAKHVSPAYRLPTGDQLVLVTGGPLKVADLDIPVKIAVADGGSTGQENISLVKGKSVLYTLCGLGDRCAINKGKASTERFLLLRREALELALYSFRYLGNVQNVVALMPPAPGQKPENALFFRRKQLKSVLSRPLGLTLPPPPPSVNSIAGSPETNVVEQLTDRNLFQYAFQQGQDLSAFLVLNKRT